MGYHLSQKSLIRLGTCHQSLQLIVFEAIKVSQVDFGIAEGHRSVERQKQLYDAGRSKIDGVRQKGMHNYSPSLAFDIYAYVNGKASWAEKDLAYLGGVITAVANMLYQSKQISHCLRWGGNWDSDGVILTDQSFIDMPHFELKK